MEGLIAERNDESVITRVKMKRSQLFLRTFYYITILWLSVTLSSLMCSIEDEEEWIKTYGTHQNNSGKWPLAQQLQTNFDKLKIFCSRAHEKWTRSKPVGVDAHVSFWLVTFENRSIEPVYADMMQYALDKDIRSDEVVPYFYMIKGNRPDCVFYLEEYQQHAKILSEMVFGDHVCGIDLKGFEDLDANKTSKS